MLGINFRSRLGMLRSKIIYLWRPLRQRRLQKFYRTFIPENSLCFDIGAHLGNRITAFRGLGARVVAVEPQPLCLDYLRKTFAADEHVTIIPKAVGASPGTAQLHISQLTPTVSTLAKPEWRAALREKSNIQVEWEEQKEVELITLDQLIATYGMPAFCKIDVEDYEAEVLKGLSQAIPGISFEFFTWTFPRTQECLQLIDQLGPYEYNWSLGESQQMASKEWIGSERLAREIQKIKGEISGDIYARWQKPADEDQE